MKILDRYILKTFLQTFFSVFIILMLIFVLQAIWLYIKELAGKDLDVVTIIKFLTYILPTLVPLIVPLTILLSSIMVFGSFAENYEFAAMKSTGISLRRCMASINVFIIVLAVITFIFSNNIIPWAQYNSYNLRKNIAKLKPAMVIAEGQFTNVSDALNIKVAKKSGENGRYLEDIIIHQKSGKRIGNHRTAIAPNGELVSAKNSNVLQLILYNGYYYDDTPPKKSIERRKKPFTKIYFDKYITNVDLNGINEKVDLNNRGNKDRYNMLGVIDLKYTIDSLYVLRDSSYYKLSNNLYQRNNIKTLDVAVTHNDTITNSYDGEIIDLFKNSQRTQVIDYSLNTLASTEQIIKYKKAALKQGRIKLFKHVLSLQKKFALAVACIILFFIGAPLGALIKKGGLGLPLVIAIVLFLTYHFIGLFAENSAKSGNMHPVLAAWFSTLIMLPLSIFSTRRATADKGLFEFEKIVVPIQKLIAKFKKSKEETQVTENSTTQKLSTEILAKVKPIITNYKQTAIISYITYVLAVVLVILYFVFMNNKLESLAKSGIQIAGVSAIIYIIYYFKSVVFYKNYTTIIEAKNTNIITKILGFFAYPLLYFKQKVNTKN